jgi:hypothetical protein
VAPIPKAAHSQGQLSNSLNRAGILPGFRPLRTGTLKTRIFAPRFGRTITRAEAATEVRRLKKLLQQCPAFLELGAMPHAEGMARAEIARSGRGFSREGP